MCLSPFSSCADYFALDVMQCSVYLLLLLPLPLILSLLPLALYYLGRSSQLRDMVKRYSGQISMTTDLWTSVANRSYAAVTFHFIDDAFKARRICAEVPHMDGPHTGDRIGWQLQVSESMFVRLCVLSTR